MTKWEKALRAYEEWEADVLNSDEPFFELLSDELSDKLKECQKLRIEALKEKEVPNLFEHHGTLFENPLTLE